MLNTTDTPTRKPDSLDVEGQLTTVEGVHAALKIVAWHDENTRDNGDAGHALHTLIDQLGKELEELREVMNGADRADCEAGDAAADDGEDEGQDETGDGGESTGESAADASLAREAKALAGMRDLTREDVAAMSPHGRKVLGSHCRRILSLVVAAEGEAPQ